MTLTLGINACRARSGGAVAHLIGLLREATPAEYDIGQVHVWSYRKLLAQLPEAPWLLKHGAAELESSLAHQLWWERFKLPKQLNETGCSVLLNVDAGSVCRFRPSITMSRDMLSYEPGEMERYGFSVARLRLVALRYVQNASLRTADGVIFLTRYAAEVVQRACGPLENVAHIPHGVGAEFCDNPTDRSWPEDGTRPIECLYISNALPYKHQWHVVEAIAQLRKQGHGIRLVLVGGGEGEAQERLEAQIAQSDPHNEFVSQHEFVPQLTLPGFLASADLFVFASSCENMPNTLVEAMAAGMPIACSDRGPMPEVLEDAGVYFDPENPESIAAAVADMIANPEKRSRLADRAKERSRRYSWGRCARETLAFVAQTAKRAGKTN
ncbi:MAG: glycosyltransferase family 4 protein [Gammaproteobacteria bacterium]|nr:glycosyltransferase family 4 protein [Gammaproteobacteria bacterium]